MKKVGRLDMGAYLCIASNGVPPSLSKRIKLDVDCEYNNNFMFCILYERKCLEFEFLRSVFLNKRKTVETSIRI